MSEQWEDVEPEVLTAMQIGGVWFLQRGSNTTDRFDWPSELRPAQLNPGAYHVKIVQGHVVAVQSRSGKFRASRGLPAGPPVAIRVGPKPAAPPRVVVAAGSKPRNGANRPSQQVPATTPVHPVIAADGDEGFINPYNFIPFGSSFPDRSAPAKHDSYEAERYCGSVPLNITAISPLLLMDQSRAEDHEDHEEWDKHKILPLRTGPDGAPILAASSVKGMLRSAFEAVTNSRMGVFETKRPYAMRELPNAALRKRPAVVAEVNGSLVLRVVRQAEVPTDLLNKPVTPEGAPWPPNQKPISSNDKSNVVRIMPAVLLPIEGPDLRANLAGSFATSAPKDRDEAFAWVHLMYHAPQAGQQGFFAWVVSDLADAEEQLPSVASAINGRCAGSYTDCRYTAKIRGALHITGSRFVTNTQQKHDERMVPLESLDGKIDLGGIDELPLGTADEPMVASGKMADEWRAVIDAYVAASKEDVPKHHKAGTYRKDRFPKNWQLTPGRTLFVSTQNIGHGVELSAKNVAGLSPAMVGRAPFPNRPAELVADELQPMSALADQAAALDAKCSPADRVFGWVSGKVGYRGHLRIDPPAAQPLPEAAASDGTAAWPITGFEPPLELAALGTPKPTQFRFYVDDPGTPKEPGSGYKKGKRTLRGRKVYPHQHQWDGENDWSGDNDRAKGRWLYTGTKHSQTRSIRGWVNPGARFTTVLHFDNLSRYELGALLYLITLASGWTAKIGMGKPLGFGSVELSAVLDDAQVFDGDAVRARYALGKATPQTAAQLEGLAKDFRAGADKMNAEVIGAFELAAKGFDGHVHYPWTTVDPQPEGYTWFVANERLAQPNKLGPITAPALPRLGANPPSRGGGGHAGGGGQQAGQGDGGQTRGAGGSTLSSGGQTSPPKSASQKVGSPPTASKPIASMPGTTPKPTGVNPANLPRPKPKPPAG